MAKKAEATEGVWQIHAGLPRAKKAVRKSGAVEDLHYNNPYGYTIERVWFDGRVIFATEQGEVEVDPKKVKVAQEYQIVYAVKLNIYDSIPGMRKYSPIWQFNYVIVPRDYVANTLRSERDCLKSGYDIRRSRVFEN